MNQSAFQVLQQQHAPQKRNIKKVPFVELFNGRVQGVVSSGSDIERVYVAFFEADTLNFYCSTNNNRPCGGLNSGRYCKHLQQLLTEAVAQYGTEAVVKYLKLPVDPGQIKKATELFRYIKGTQKKEPANEVFSRFLNYLRYLELKSSNSPLPEMTWFI